MRSFLKNYIFWILKIYVTHSQTQKARVLVVASLFKRQHCKQNPVKICTCSIQDTENTYLTKKNGRGGGSINLKTNLPLMQANLKFGIITSKTHFFHLIILYNYMRKEKIQYMHEGKARYASQLPAPAEGLRLFPKTLLAFKQNV